MEANNFAAGEATGPANFESTQSYTGTIQHGEVVSTEPSRKLDSVKMELGDRANQDGQGDSGLGSFLRRLPR